MTTEELKDFKFSYMGEMISISDVEMDPLLYTDCEWKELREYANSLITGVYYTGDLFRIVDAGYLTWSRYGNERIDIHDVRKNSFFERYYNGSDWCCGFSREELYYPVYSSVSRGIRVYRTDWGRLLVNKFFIGPIAPKNVNHPYVVGDKVTLALRCDSVGDYQSMFGEGYIFTFRDQFGNLYKWFTSSQPSCKEGEWHTMKFTVKKNDIWAGEVSTIITRARVLD